MSQTAVLRILDANANRAAEGLRVVEEFVRFVLDDAHLTGICKQLRHDLTDVVATIPLAERLRARETAADVGTEATTVAEFQRESPAAVAAASLSRVQQSLRVLEEYAKLLDPQIAARLEPLRYRLYTLSRAIGIAAESRRALNDLRLYVLLDGGPSPEGLEQSAASLLAAGVQAIQLRDKQRIDRELVERARRLRRVTAEAGALLIINDRPDIAAVVHADGVHVGQDELTVKDARAVVGPQRLIGVSTHSLDQARTAVLDGADYLGVGPTFPSGTKQFSAFTGVELLRQVAAEVSLPAFAIGGVNLANLDEVLDAGFRRAAVAGAIVKAADPPAAAAEFRRRLDSASRPRLADA
ncbi:MAG: thiamine phosphate synthase [Pirellulaceae bacterium]